LEELSKRTGDLNQQQIYIGQRIDALREELTQRIDETNRRIDALREDLTQRIDALREELTQRIDETNRRIDETNRRMDSLYEVIVRREEHTGLQERVADLEKKYEYLEKQVATG